MLLILLVIILVAYFAPNILAEGVPLNTEKYLIAEAGPTLWSKIFAVPAWTSAKNIERILNQCEGGTRS